MPYQPLTPEQFEKARQAGFSTDQIIEMERRRKAEQTVPQEPQDGFVKTVTKSIAMPFARLGVNAVKVGQIATGQKVDPKAPINVPFLGQVKPVGQEGNFARKVLDSVGVGTEIASTVIPTARGTVGVAKAGLKGLIGQGIKTGVKSGLASGTLYGVGHELQNPEATAGSVASKGAIGAATGLAAGAVTGAAAPIVGKTVRTAINPKKELTKSNLLNPDKIMQRVARVNPTDQVKFKKAAGEEIGEYLTKRGIYGDEQQIITQLYNRFAQSKQTADDALAKLGGKWKAAPIQTALDDLVARESRISSPGAHSRDLSRVKELFNKHKKDGLSMTEINEVKRLFEKNIKLDYLKQNLPESVARANTIDDAIRNWQFTQADKLGLKNLPEINKETRLARQLADALWKKNAGQQANNALSLTDAVLVSGGDPTAISMLVARKTLSNKRVQSGIAKALAPKPSVAPSAAKTHSLLGLPAPKAGTPKTQVNTGSPIPLPSDSTKLQSYFPSPAKKNTPPQAHTILQRQGKSLPFGIPKQAIKSSSLPTTTQKGVSSPKPNMFKRAKEYYDSIPNKEGGFAKNPFDHRRFSQGILTPLRRKELERKVEEINRIIDRTKDKAIAKNYAKARDMILRELQK